MTLPKKLKRAKCPSCGSGYYRRIEGNNFLCRKCGEIFEKEKLKPRKKPEVNLVENFMPQNQTDKYHVQLTIYYERQINSLLRDPNKIDRLYACLYEGDKFLGNGCSSVAQSLKISKSEACKLILDKLHDILPQIQKEPLKTAYAKKIVYIGLRFLSEFRAEHDIKGYP